MSKEIIFKETGTTIGFEHYYGEVFIDNEKIGRWACVPLRNKEPKVYFTDNKGDLLTFGNMYYFKKHIKSL